MIKQNIKNEKLPATKPVRNPLKIAVNRTLARIYSGQQLVSQDMLKRLKMMSKIMED